MNDECDVTADLEPDAAIERMRREYRGAPETYRVTELNLKVPVAITSKA